MADKLNVATEQEDDIPVLLAQGKKIGIPELLDQHFWAHGNWRGTCFGWTSLVGLAHILLEGDHRLNQIEQWVKKRPHMLEISIWQPMRGLEWSDDQLGIVLNKLADAEKWKAFGTDLNRRTFRVYNMELRGVRVDGTTISGYWTVMEDGLFEFGQSKHQHPDLPQLKVMLSALDLLSMPVAIQVISGEGANDNCTYWLSSKGAPAWMTMSYCMWVTARWRLWRRGPMPSNRFIPFTHTGGRIVHQLA